MGISGLLQGLKSAAALEHSTKESNIRDFAHKCVAVDASSWLHKSVYSIADHYVEVTEQSGRIDSRCIATASNYVLKRCHELLTYAHLQRIFLVMDGERIPLKSVTNQERERRRQQNLQQAREFRKMGNRDQMFDKYKACIKVRAELGRAVAAAVVRKYGPGSRQVQIVWAPYEADAQMVKLCVDGLAQAIITEDSDVLVYAATCQIPTPILFKLDRNNGNCDVISMAWLVDQKAMKQQAVSTKAKKKKRPSGLDAFLQAFCSRESRTPGSGVRLFVQSCVLAGCDYAPNQLDGVGSVTAFKHVRNAVHRKSDERFHHVIQALPNKVKQPIAEDLDDYKRLLCQSEAVFYYHPVRELCSSKIVLLNDPQRQVDTVSLEQFEGDLSFLGDLEASPAPVFTSNASNIASLPLKRKADAEPSSSLKRTTYAPMSTGEKEFARAAQIVNPYKKRVQPDERRPLKPRSPNEKTAKRKNPFSHFARGKENPLKGDEKKKPNPFLEAFRSKQDVRFVKRIFTKDGNHAALPTELAKASLKQAPPAMEESEPIDKIVQTDVNMPAKPPVADSRRSCESSRFVHEKQLASDDETEIIDLEMDSSSVVDSPTPEGKKTNATSSRFFPKSNGYVRRVTVDSPSDPRDSLEEPSSYHSPSNDVRNGAQQNGNEQCPQVIDLSKNAVPASVKFDLYDDFYSPRKDNGGQALEADEIVDSSPDNTVAVHVMTRTEPPKPRSSIGPAKTIRFRFGGPAMAQESRSQQQQPRKAKSRKAGQTSLFSHFQRVSSRK